MTDYTKSVNFATKDALITGDPLKVVKGTEINTELDNLATSIATKFDKAGGTITGATSIAAALTSTSLLNLARGSIVQHATTMDLWALPNTLDGTGSAVTITAIVNAPQAGPMRRFYGIAGTIWTNNAMFAVDGGTFTFVAGDYVDVETVTTATYKVHPFKADGTAVFNAGRQIQPITATAAAGALTITLLPTTLDYRSTTLTSGTVTTVTNAASLSTVISSGSTAGGTSAVALRLVILAINNAGVSEIAWTNLAGGINLDETGVITTVAEGGAGAADSANVIYSTTARTGVAYRVVGFSDITNTTAGTWLTPTLTQGTGGQALASLSSFGFGQTFQNVTASRANATTYTNTTGKAIEVFISAVLTTATITIGATTSPSLGTTTQIEMFSFTVPSGFVYSVAGMTLTAWLELR